MSVGGSLVVLGVWRGLVVVLVGWEWLRFGVFDGGVGVVEV